MISMKECTISMEVGDQKVNFNMYEAIRHPYEDYSLLGVNAIDVVLESVNDVNTIDSLTTNDSVDKILALCSTNSALDITNCA